MQGTLYSAATFCLLSWVISIRGPTYPSMFNPVGLIFVTVTEALLLGEAIRVGRYVFFFFHSHLNSLQMDNNYLNTQDPHISNESILILWIGIVLYQFGWHDLHSNWVILLFSVGGKKKEDEESELTTLVDIGHAGDLVNARWVSSIPGKARQKKS